MEGKHTSGPWTPVIESRANREAGIVIVDAPESVKSICRTYEALTDADAQESLANARLIAAGPDLLEACEAVVSALSRASAHHIAQCKLWGAFDKVKAAIAKAKGEDS